MIYSNNVVNPGEELKSIMDEQNLSSNSLAKLCGFPTNRISDIVRNRRGITPETSIVLGRALGIDEKYLFSVYCDYIFWVETQNGK